nr:immunoglobulin light chain junction region [Macaca mulatta]
CQQYNDLIITF